MADICVKMTVLVCVFSAIMTVTGANMLANGDFEEDLSDWYCLGGCTVTQSTDVYQGAGSAMVTNRNFKWMGIAQKVPEAPAGTRFELQAYIKLLNLAPGALYDTAEMIMKCLDANTGDKPVYTKFGVVPQIRENIWTKIGGYNFIREGLHTCVVYVALERPEVNYVIDVMSLKEVPEITNWRTKAEANIEKFRKGTITIRLKKAPPGNYTIEVTQKSHVFAFGSVVGADEMVDPTYENYQEFFYNNFEWGVLGNALKWNAMERNRDVIDYERSGQALEALQSRGIKIRGHNVFWGVEKHVPTWMKTLDTSEVDSEISDRIMGVVNFTKGIVEHWDVNNEVLHGDWFEQASGDANITMRMFEEVHAVDSEALLFVNDYGVMESQHAMGIRDQAHLYRVSGIPIHAVGLQSHITPADVDITLLKTRLDLVAEAGLPIWITELSMDEPNATIKARALTDVMTLYFSHRDVKGIILWGFSDQRIWKPDSKLFEGPDITPNEAGTAFLDLMDSWRTREAFVMAKGDKSSFKAFKGDYSLVVKSGDTILQTRQFSLDKKKTIKLRIKRQKN